MLNSTQVSIYLCSLEVRIYEDQTKENYSKRASFKAQFLWEKNLDEVALTENIRLEHTRDRHLLFTLRILQFLFCQSTSLRWTSLRIGDHGLGIKDWGSWIGDQGSNF